MPTQKSRPAVSEENMAHVDWVAKKVMGVDPDGVSFNKKLEAIVTSHEQYDRPGHNGRSSKWK